MKKIISVTVAFIMILSAATPLFAADTISPEASPDGGMITIYVSPTAEDGGNGSSSLPYRTPHEALEAVRNARLNGPEFPAEILFYEGVYQFNETLLLNGSEEAGSNTEAEYTAPNRADSAEAQLGDGGITFKAMSGDVIFTGEFTASGGTSVLSASLVEVSGASDVAFEGITFTDNLNAPLVRVCADGVTFRSCTFSNSGMTRVPQDRTDCFALKAEGEALSVEGCEIFNVYGGIYLSGGDRYDLTPSGNVISECYIHDVQQTAVSVCGVGVHVKNNEIRSCGVSAVRFTDNSHVIEKNHVSYPGKYGVVAGGGVTCYGTRVRHNFIDGAEKTAVSLEGGASGVTVCGNILKDAPCAVYTDGGRDVNVTENVILFTEKCPDKAPVAVCADTSYSEGVLTDSSHYYVLLDEYNSVEMDLDAWIGSYPSFAYVSVPQTHLELTDLTSPELFYNAADNTVKDNAVYVTGDVRRVSLDVSGYEVDGVPYVKRYGEVSGNTVLPRGSISDFPAHEFGNYAISPKARLFEVFPDFDDIPFNAIGIPRVTSRFTFTDVKVSSWYYKWVVYVTDRGIMSGTDNKGISFSPKAVTSRAMMIRMLYNLEGSPEVEYKPVFDDVPEKAWYAKAVIWAAENGITSGTSEGKFSPSGEVTREQMAVFLYRYLRDYKKVSPESSGDVSVYLDGDTVSSYRDFDAAVRWAVGSGIITGKSTPTGVYLAPGDTAQRCEAAAVFARLCLGR